MSANPCRDFFAWHADDRSVAKELQKNLRQSLDWQSLSASDHSPDAVKDTEMLYRQVVQPIHIDPVTRLLKPTAFDDASNKGLSVERLAYKSLYSIVASGRKRSEAQRAKGGAFSERKLFAVAGLSAATVREICDQSGQKCFGIYDTANCDNSAHADICQLVSGTQSGRSARAQLLDLAQKNLIEGE